MTSKSSVPILVFYMRRKRTFYHEFITENINDVSIVFCTNNLCQKLHHFRPFYKIFQLNCIEPKYNSYITTYISPHGVTIE